MTSAIATADGAAGSQTRVPPALRGALPSWAAVAAWGAGLIEIALGAGALTQGGAARGAGIALVALGAGALAWGVAALVRGRIVVPRTGVAASLAGIAAGILALTADPVRTSIVAVGAASALLLATALACASRLRGRGERRADAAPPRTWVMIAAAIVVAAVVTPALAATEAGRNASPHGEHMLVDPGHH
ncbi:hypothetical protein [Microbacterium sp. HJ5]